MHNQTHSTKTSALKTIAWLVPAIALTATLTGCGGGGGGGAGTGGNTGGGSTPSYQAPVASVPAPTYTAADSLAAASGVNAARSGSGAGLLAQNAALDTAATSHASFLVDNNLLTSAYLTVKHGSITGGHYEDTTLAGSTGADPQTRATAAGYSGTVTELLSFGAASGADCIASISNSVYHLIDLLSSTMDIGLDFNAGNGSGSVCVIELGTPGTTLGQLPTTAPVVYPGDNLTGVPPIYYATAEVPQIPSASQTVGQTMGHPVAVSLYTQANPTLAGTDIVIHGFALSTSSGGTALGAMILAENGVTSDGPTLTADANLNLTQAGYVVLVPTTQLTANTTYYVSFDATVKGAAVTKTWSFTTGAAN
jgi:uncharacterized protein YkwD